jgi:hypothetical protein
LSANGRTNRSGSAGANDGYNAPRIVKYWEIIADNLGKAGCSWGFVSAIDSQGRTIWIVVFGTSGPVT